MLTSDNVADCPCAAERMEGLSAEHLIADKGHNKPKSRACRCTFQCAKIRVNMTNTSIDNAIWWKTPLRTFLHHEMHKMQPKQ